MILFVPFFLQAHCSHFESFPPGHYYVGKSLHGEVKGEMKPFYHSKWFKEIDYIPDHPLDLAEFRSQLCASGEKVKLFQNQSRFVEYSSWLVY